MSDTPTYIRKCQNWLLDFGKQTLPRSEAPESFVFWTGLFTLSAVLKRKIYISKKYLGSWTAFPNLYIIFIAPAGKARKSTTTDYASDLLVNISNMTSAPTQVTKENVLTRLVKSTDSSMYVLSREFGEFIMKSGTEMFGVLTNLYDGLKEITVGTMTRAEFADKPCMNLLAATTPEWVSENMPESIIGGGFASRVIFIKEDAVRRRKLFYDDLDQKELDHLFKNLVADLAHISENVMGEFDFTPEAKEFVDKWYTNTADETVSHKIQGYIERRPAHVLKVAMILHVAYSDELILDKRDIDEAIKLLQQTEKNLPTVFQSVGKNPYTVDLYQMLDYISIRGEVTKESVRRHFMHAAAPAMLTELIDGLMMAGYVTARLDGNDTYLKASSNGKLD